jgi:hypothetical protein
MERIYAVLRNRRRIEVSASYGICNEPSYIESLVFCPYPKQYGSGSSSPD